MVFEGVQQGPPDIMYYLKMDADGDNDPNKTDLGVGVYRNENGTYHELAVLKEVSFNMELAEILLGVEADHLR